MKLVIWTDNNGLSHRSWLRDEDPDHLAPSGVPDDPPDLFRLDWEELRRNLHNELVTRGLVTWRDIENSQTGLTSSILSAFKRPLVGLYRAAPPEPEG